MPVRSIAVRQMSARSRADEIVSSRGAVNPYSLGDQTTSYGGIVNRNEAQHQTQYSRYHDRVYSAIRVAKSRMMAQPIYVGRISRKANNRRSLKSWLSRGVISESQIPLWMKAYEPGDVEMLDDHRLLSTLHRPNELMVRSHLWDVTVANIFVTGRSLWLVSDSDSLSGYSIFPIPTTWATPDHAHAEKSLTPRWMIKPPGSAVEPIPVEGKYVANFYVPDPENPLECISAVQMISRAVECDESISMAQHRTFQNAINPLMAITVGEAATSDGKRQVMLTPLQRKQLMAWVRQELQGARNFGLPMILDAMIKSVENLSKNPIEMAFLESSNLTKGHIFEGIGVNPISAGQVEGSNRASSGIADHHLLVNCVNPILQMMSEVMTSTLAPLFADGNETLKVWIAPCEPYDPDLRLQMMEGGSKHGSVYKNEWRQFLGLPMKPELEGQLAIPTATPQQGESRRPSTQDGPPPSANPKSHKSSDAVARKAYLDLWLKQHENGEEALAKDLSDFIVSQRNSAVAKVRNNGPENVFDPDEWDSGLLDVVMPHLRSLMIRGAASLNFVRTKAAGVQIGFNLSGNVISSIRNSLDDILSQNYWHDINVTTQKDIISALQGGISLGESNQQLAQRVFDAMDGDYPFFRARRIARSETTQALNAGHYAQHEELAADGVVDGLQWLGIGDDDERKTHLALNDTIVKNGEMFNVGGYPAPYPAHYSLPAHERVFCRCTPQSVSVPS